MRRISFLLMLMMLGAMSFGQEFRGTISGRVADPSGAVIQKAHVVVTNTATGASVNTYSNGEGYYTAPFLVPGPYQVTVDAAGFKKFAHSGINLQTQAHIEENVTLQLGSEAETVSVSADAPLIDTSSATSGQVLTTAEIENLPSNGRSPIGLVRNEYGVIPKEKHALAEVRPFDNSGGSDFSMGGGNAQSNEILLNGTPNMEDSGRVSAFSPAMDAVNEIRADQFSSDASAGDTSGGTVNITTKSGTNQFHGTLSEFNETSALAAKLYFTPAGQKVPATRQNQYGGTIGGPVWIPKIYNGRDKLFFFYAYEGFRDSTPTAIFSTVPTAAERTGDFSALLALGANYQLYNPYAATAVTANGKTTIVRQPIPGNVLSNAGLKIDPVAAAYLKYYPQPNQPGGADGENNYFSSIPTVDDYTSNMGRLDYALTANNKAFAELHESNLNSTASNIFKNIATGTTMYTHILGGSVDDIHTFSPTLTLDTRLGFTRYTTNSTVPSLGFKPSKLGFPGYIDSHSTELAMPYVKFSESKGTVPFATLSAKLRGVEQNTDIQFFSALTKALGHHFIKIGPDLRAQKRAGNGPNYANGNYSFSSTWMTSASTKTASPFGPSLASFLLGLPTSGEYDINTPSTYSNYYSAGFLQDDWKVKQNLTINIGVRLEHETPVVESNNEMTVAFLPNATNSATAAANAAYATIYAKYGASNPIPSPTNFHPTGGLVFASSSKRNGYNTPALYVSPRIGLAWSPEAMQGKMAVRAGFGIFDNPFNIYNTGPSFGYSQISTFVPTTNSFLSPAATLSDPFPTGSNPIQLPAGSSQGINTNLGGDTNFYTPNVRVPYNERWSFDIQQQLSRNMMLDIGYIGSHQVHLSYNNNLNALPVQYLSRSPKFDAAVTSTLSATVPNPMKGLLPGSANNGSTTTVANLLSAFPAYSGGSDNSGMTERLVPGSSATFHMLAVRVTKRLAQGLQFNANYEWSRQLETSQLNDGGPLTYQETSSDFPQHFVLTGSYDLPFGRNRQFFNGVNRLTDVFIGGWMVNAIYAAESGAPISWGNVIYLGLPLQSNQKNIHQAFNTAAFDRVSADQPNSYNYRTFPSFFMRSDVQNNADLSVAKNFTITERAKLQYRFEAFNAFNRVQFAAPNTGPTSSKFGQINGQANTGRVIQMGLRFQY